MLTSVKNDQADNFSLGDNKNPTEPSKDVADTDQGHLHAQEIPIDDQMVSYPSISKMPSFVQLNIINNIQVPSYGPVDSQNPFGDSQMEVDINIANRSQKADGSKVVGRSPMTTRFNGTKVPNLTNNNSSSPTPSRSSRRFTIKEQEAQNKEKYTDAHNNQINS